MSYVRFKWDGSSPLGTELRKPLEKLSFQIQYPKWRGATSVTLWRTDGTVLTLGSEMYDVAPRLEVGVLNFSCRNNPDVDTGTIDLGDFRGEIDVSKLVIADSGTTAESGIILKCGSKELIIVAGAFPLTLAVGGVVTGLGYFEPEYPLELYARVPLP